MIYNSNWIFRIVIIYTIVIMMITGCNYFINESVNTEDIAKVVNNVNDSGVLCIEQTEEEISQIYDICKNFNFAIQEYPINTDVYDSDMDREYKKAFLKYLFHTVDVTYDEDDEEETFFYDFALEFGAGAAQFSNDDYLEAMENRVQYWYLDFDGDGMPELVVYLKGVMYKPIILKYKSEEQRVYVYVYGSNHWNFLCSGNLYYDDPTSAGINRYALSRYNIFGNEVITFEFNIQIMEDCSREYTISYHNEEDMNNIIEASAIVSEEMWNELTKDFFYAIDNVPPSMTFHEVFGELSSLYIH